MLRLAAAFALALAAGLSLASDRVPRPEIVVEKPGQCVEPTDVMRRDHMKFLLHQRDLTVHEGIRTPKYSLAACVECHASTKTGSVLGQGGFCQDCHSYASVKLDCFECHAAKPERLSAQARP